jgi:hypothetical protein
MKKIWIKILFCFFTLIIKAQELKETLYNAGFENVQVLVANDSSVVFFEHREFRIPYHSMQLAKLILDNSGEQHYNKLSFIPMYHNVPIGKYTAEAYNYSSLTQSETEAFRTYNKVLKNYRLSLRIQPEVISRFGFYSDPFQTKFNINLDSRIYIARGLSFQTGITVPVVNNLDNQNLQLRLAPSMIHYFDQPWDHNFISLSIGSFYNNRYGIDFEYRNADLSKRWSFGFATGLTGFYWLNGLSLYNEPLDDIYLKADLEYRLPFENLSLKLTAGQFLYKDKGLRFDLVKQYAAAEIGLFASSTNIGTTTGFQFAFSLFPGKLYRNKKLEVRTTEEFRWEYTYNNFEPVAHDYRLGIPRLPDVLRQYNQNFMSSLK